MRRDHVPSAPCAVTVVPFNSGSAGVVDVDEPAPGPGDLLVDGPALGVGGTDREIAAGGYGWAPPGRERLILGHESLGRVRQAPDDSRFAEGDLVVGVVRRPDPEPCPAGGRGEFNMCRNGRYTEHGIKEIDGFAAEQWTIEADYAVKLDPRLERVGILMEPASIVAKAWDHNDSIGNRAYFAPERVLVTAVAVGVYCFRGTPVDHRTHPGIAAWVAFAGVAVMAALVTAGLVHLRHIRA